MKLLTLSALLTSILLGSVCIVPVASAAPNRSTSPDELMSKVTEVSCRMPFQERTAFGTKARKVSCPGGQCLTEKETPDTAVLAFQPFQFPGMRMEVATSLEYHFPLSAFLFSLSPEHSPLVRSSMIVVLRE